MRNRVNLGKRAEHMKIGSLLRLLLTMLLIAAMLMSCGAAEGSSDGAGEKQELLIVTKDQQTDKETAGAAEDAGDSEEDKTEETADSLDAVVTDQEEAVQEKTLQESIGQDGSEQGETAEEGIAADGSYANGSPYTRDQAMKLLFRKKANRDQHYEKHGIEMGFKSAEDYLQAAREVVANPKALHKLEKEDGDDVYFLEETSEFVVVSSDGYLRTYFIPSAGKKYYDRQ